MAWVRLDDVVPHHPKHLRAGPEACWLWVCALAYCQRQLTDGFIPSEALPFIGVSEKSCRALAERLVSVRLFDRAEGGYRVHDYQDHNLSKDEAIERKGLLSETRASAGRRGAESRWQNHSKPMANRNGNCHDGKWQADSKTIANANSKRMAPSHPIPSHKEEIPTSSLAPSAEPRPELPPRPKSYGRFDLHRWQVDALMAMLGPHADGFGLDVWLHDLSAKATERNLVLDPRVKWPWVQGELRAECERRGLAIAAAQHPPESSRQRATHRTDRSMAFGASGPSRWQCPHETPCPSRMSCAAVMARKCPHVPPCDDGGLCISRILEGDVGMAAKGVA